MENLNELGDHFSKVEDPRGDKGKLHKLEEILTIAICSIICGADGFAGMEQFGESKKEWFNDNRNKETYAKVLNPLYDKVLEAVNGFKYIDITSRELTVQKLHNYHRTDLGTRSNPQKRTALDYWDVIILEFDARIKRIC